MSVTDSKKPFSKDILVIGDVENKVNSITQKLKLDITSVLKRKGAIIGISGGIDSSVTLALTARALGPENVLALILPEKDSSSDSKELALKLAAQYGVKTLEENISKALEGFGCYRRRDEAVKAVFPEYDPGSYSMKIGINAKSISRNLPPVFSLTIVDKNGEEKSKLLPGKNIFR